MLCPTTTISLFIDYEEIKEKGLHCNDAFKELISKNEYIIEFRNGVRSSLNDSDLEIIATELLRNNGIEQLEGKSSRELYIEYLDNEIEKLAKSISISLAPVIQRLSEWQIPIIENFSKLAEALNRSPVFTTLTNLANSKMNSAFVEGMNVFLKSYNEIISSFDKATLIALKYDWFISYKTLENDELFTEIIAYGERETSQSDFDSLFTKHFSNDQISDIINEIASSHQGKKFSKILTDVLLGYNAKLYYLVVPTCLSILEGLIATTENHHGRMNRAQYEAYLSKILMNRRFSGIRTIIMQRVFVKFEHGDELDSPISRHAILHGADQNYGTQENCIRCILILHELTYAIKMSKN
ncbi:MAG: hypothetical protein AB9921_00020 [Erysipelotrichaceae bacterium]